MAESATGPANNRRRKLSLAARFSLFVCGLVLLVGLTAVATFLHENEQHIATHSQAVTGGFGAAERQALARGMAAHDEAAIQGVAKSLAAVPSVVAVSIEDGAGREMIALPGPQAGKRSERIEAFDLAINAANGAPLGRLKYQVARDAIALPPGRDWVLPLLGLCAVMVLSIPLTLMMVRRATAPLRQLTAFAEQVGAHRLTMQIDIQTGDEFETLARAFNHMIGRLDASMRRIQRLAFVDPATDLPNADRLQRDLRVAIDAALKGGAPGALFVLQLDRLHRATETLGQEAADELLAASAQRLATAARAADPWANVPAPHSGAPAVLARLSANEFAVLFPTLPKGVELRAMANALAQPFDQSFEWREHRLALGSVLGAAFFPRDGRDGDEVLRHARLALVAARETPLRMRVFTRSLDRAATAKLNLEKEMRAALETNQFRAYFQPKINMRNNRIVGAEALARWVRPDRSIISPLKFIPAAEEMGLICQISESILRDACWKAAAWSREGLPARVAVNVSALQFADDAFPQKVLKILDQAGLPPQCLEMEITESVAMQDVDRAVKMIEPLREHGVRFAIDDFGTGHSSLSAITRMPFEVLKIDQSFVRGLSKENSHAPAIVETILAMTAALNFDCVAEGVETEGEAEFLRRRGCPVAQGFLYSAAVPPSEYLKLLRDGVITPGKGASTTAPAPALDLAG
jgi:predicted signal transduction protein with EAL and GGDEF domain